MRVRLRSLIDQEIDEGKVTNLRQAEAKSRPGNPANYMHLQKDSLLQNDIIILMTANFLGIVQVAHSEAVSQTQVNYCDADGEELLNVFKVSRQEEGGVETVDKAHYQHEAVRLPPVQLLLAKLPAFA